jgi:hypothetical protein
MSRPAKGHSQSEAARAKIGKAAEELWKDPEVRAKRQAGLVAAWERRRVNLGICSECGQPLPEDNGRD